MDATAPTMITGAAPSLPAQPRRLRFRDLKPLEIPESLDDLAGPYSGHITLPHGVRWQPDRQDIDLEVPGRRHMAYQALLAEGTDYEQRLFLNAKRLIDDWGLLALDPRVRTSWERRFPALTGSAS